MEWVPLVRGTHSAFLFLNLRPWAGWGGIHELDCDSKVPAVGPAVRRRHRSPVPHDRHRQRSSARNEVILLACEPDEERCDVLYTRRRQNRARRTGRHLNMRRQSPAVTAAAAAALPGRGRRIAISSNLHPAGLMGDA
jgi:hypothetical protein